MEVYIRGGEDSDHEEDMVNMMDGYSKDDLDANIPGRVFIEISP